MGGKTGRKGRHFLRPQALEKKEACAQLSELQRTSGRTAWPESWGGQGVWEKEPSPHQHEPEGTKTLSQHAVNRNTIE